jgi:hypothetical protein
MRRIALWNPRRRKNYSWLNDQCLAEKAIRAEKCHALVETYRLLNQAVLVSERSRARRQQARSARRKQRDACEDQIERAVRLRVGDAGSDDPTDKRTAEDLADNEKNAEESHGRRAHVRGDLAGDDVARGSTQ